MSISLSSVFVILSENQGETGLRVIHVISVVNSFRTNEKDRNNKTSLTTDSNKKKKLIQTAH